MPSSFRGLRILVTGGLGFIGSNLARQLLALDAGQIVLVDSLIPEYGGNLFNIQGIEKDVVVNVADVRDEHSMRQLVRDKDVLFNLAGQTSHVDSMTRPLHRSGDQLPRAALHPRGLSPQQPRDSKIVYASTRQIYGRPEYLPVDERHLLRPIDVNGINKMAGEWYHILYNNVYGIRASRAAADQHIRACACASRMLARPSSGVWIRNLLRGEEILIYGDGSQLRDFNYVDDAVEGLLAAALSDKAVGEVFNLGAEAPLSLNELAALLIKLNASGCSRVVPFPNERLAIDIGDYYADFGKAVALLGWKPRIAVAEGLKRTLDFYREFGEHYA